MHAGYVVSFLYMVPIPSSVSFVFIVLVFISLFLLHISHAPEEGATKKIPFLGRSHEEDSLSERVPRRRFPFWESPKKKIHLLGESHEEDSPSGRVSYIYRKIRNM